MTGKNGKEPGTYTVGKLLKEKTLELRAGFRMKNKLLQRNIAHAEIHRPVMALLGHFYGFPAGRLQVLGREELEALKHTMKEGRHNYKKMPQGDMPCLLITHKLAFPPEFTGAMKKAGVPVLKTRLSTREFIKRITQVLEEKLSSAITIQGVMMDVSGMGVLICGASGIGKSECALELLKMGHRIISDDMILVKKRSPDILVAASPGISRHYIEVRGLGIIDVESIFGIGSVRDATKIELVVKLEEWDKEKEYDRLGTEKRYTEILGIKISEVVIPVTAGRSLAVIIELAAKNQKLKNEGHYAVKELEKQLMKRMKKENE